MGGNICENRAAVIAERRISPAPCTRKRDQKIDETHKSAAKDAGLDGGFLIWNAANELQRYYDFGWAWHSYE